MEPVAPSKKKKAKLQLVTVPGASSSSTYEPVSIPTDLFGVGEESGFDGKTNLSGKHREFGLVFRHPCTSNSDLEAIVKVAKTLVEAKTIKYFVIKREIGTANEKLHLQSYAWFEKPQRYASVRKFFPMDANLGVQERRAKFRTCLRNYILKKETTDPAPGSGPFEVGTFHPNEPGKRTDLDHLCEMLKEGKTQRELFNESPATWCRNYRSLSAAEAFIAKPLARDPPKIVVIWGPTGTGKTRSAHQIALIEAAQDTSQIYIYSLRNNFWENYTDQRIVIFDEFPGTEEYVPYRDLLGYLDRYSVQVNKKGASAWLKATHFIFTSNTNPVNWYAGHHYNQGQLLRRLRDFGKVINLVPAKAGDEVVHVEQHKMTLTSLMSELQVA